MAHPLAFAGADGQRIQGAAGCKGGRGWRHRGTPATFDPHMPQRPPGLSRGESKRDIVAANRLSRGSQSKPQSRCESKEFKARIISYLSSMDRNGEQGDKVGQTENSACMGQSPSQGHGLFCPVGVQVPIIKFPLISKVVCPRP
jgi:hypothetical protein